MMTVEQLMDLFLEADYQRVGLYDLNLGDYIYLGEYGNMKDEYRELTVESVDNISESTDVLTINMCLED